MVASGIPAGQSATVTITAVGVEALTTGDGRCQQQGAGLVCTVSGSGPIAVHTERIPNGNASVTVTVTGGGEDPNPANNSASLVLDSK